MDDDYKEYKDPPVKIDSIISILAYHQSCLAGRLEASWDELDAGELARLLTLYGQIASRLGRLLRDRYALHGDSYERFEAVKRSMAERVAQQSLEERIEMYGYDVLADIDMEKLTTNQPAIEVDRVIADLNRFQNQLDCHIDFHDWDSTEAASRDRLLAVYSQNATRLGRLLRHRAVIYGPPPDPLKVMINKALDSVWEEMEAKRAESAQRDEASDETPDCPADSLSR